ncbi:hypothetical protein DB30_06369 [Enhygromyxa salina]|uniref:Uncharacterized protein n=1 Tax=Enhygromyxa salina TaxID=215803 RepID=A0A0C1ZUR1_9BACT|nr:hypothetical protein [Enhygromyxa salina]KIG14783.1 hypothetical protein DB30_06369 [Enhygromyxa salina]
MHRIRPTAPPPASYLIPAFTAALWWAVMTMVADQGVATQRSLVFLGGPLVLLSGLHARLFTFLHAPDRIRWLPLPIAVARHWLAGIQAHLPAFTLTAALAAGALYLASDITLVVEFCWFVVFAGLLEPLASALAAMFGRRFPEGSRARELQRSLGGGWTTPEAVVHLYAPAFALALAVLLAMPGQLSWERWVDGHALGTTQIAVSLTPLLLALGLRLAAPALYRAGVWEAVPWLSEATRTLAGPPQPEPTPGWVRRVPDAWARLLIVQFLRMTPLPYLRLAIVVGLAVHAALAEQAPGGPGIALGLAAIGLWTVPAGTVMRAQVARARLAGALPLSASKRRGHSGILAASALALPPLGLLGVILLRLLG